MAQVATRIAENRAKALATGAARAAVGGASTNTSASRTHSAITGPTCICSASIGPTCICRGRNDPIWTWVGIGFPSNRAHSASIGSTCNARRTTSDVCNVPPPLGPGRRAGQSVPAPAPTPSTATPGTEAAATIPDDGPSQRSFLVPLEPTSSGITGSSQQSTAAPTERPTAPFKAAPPHPSHWN